MKLAKSLVYSVFAFFALSPLFARAVDYSSMTDAFDFTDAILTFVAIGAVLMGVLVAWRGVKFVIQMAKA